MDLLALAYHAGRVGCPDAYNVVQDMAQTGRGVHVPIDHQTICP